MKHSDTGMYEDVFTADKSLVSLAVWNIEFDEATLEVTDSEGEYVNVSLTKPEVRELLLAFGKIYNQMEDHE